jgi:hypothetical protein
LPGFAGKRIVLADDTLFFRTEEVQLDLDGAPRAYGVRDQGFEDICNGLAPLEPPECKGKNRGECYRPCQSAFAAWSGNDIAKLGDSMCAIGLGGGDCSKPEVRLQDPPNDDWFVSETKVQVAPPPGMRVSSWIRTQPAQLDPLELPYFVIPSGFRARPWDATPGDAGVILNRKTGTAVAFVIGDTGGSLDEGSAKLLAKLRGLSALATAMKVSALGERVERVRGALNGDFRVAIFRHSAPLLPRAAEPRCWTRPAPSFRAGSNRLPLSDWQRSAGSTACSPARGRSGTSQLEPCGTGIRRASTDQA